MSTDFWSGEGYGDRLSPPDCWTCPAHRRVGAGRAAEVCPRLLLLLLLLLITEAPGRAYSASDLNLISSSKPSACARRIIVRTLRF